LTKYVVKVIGVALNEGSLVLYIKFSDLCIDIHTEYKSCMVTCKIWWVG